MAVMRYYALRSGYFDLGVFENNIANIAFNFELSRAFFVHSQPLLLLYAFIYRLAPSPVTLVVAQSLMLASPVIILSRYKDFLCGDFPLAIVQYIYMLSPFVWYNALFDFHLDHIVIPLGFAFFAFCMQGKWGRAFVCSLLFALIKEPFALVTVFCGVYLALGYRRFSMGALVVLFGAAYFLLMIKVVIPYFTPGLDVGIAQGAFTWMGEGIVAIFLFLLTHPLEVAMDILGNHGKVLYLLSLFGSLSFLPLLGGTTLLPAFPILAISLLSRWAGYYGIGHHYTAGLIAPLTVAFVRSAAIVMRLSERIGLSRRCVKAGVVVVMLAANILISPSPISRLFWSNKIWRYGYMAYLPDTRSRMITEAVKKYVPSDPNVAVSTQNNINMSYLVKRKVCLPYPEAVLKPHLLPDWDHPGVMKPVSADYVILDLKRPLFLEDKGCDWQYGECRDKKMVTRFMETVAETRKVFSSVYENDGFMILERNR